MGDRRRVGRGKESWEREGDFGEKESWEREGELGEGVGRLVSGGGVGIKINDKIPTRVKLIKRVKYD